jgi:hypothetical protein
MKTIAYIPEMEAGPETHNQVATKDGHLELCKSPFNILLLPFRKSDGSYWLVQDLHAINQIVPSRHPVIPNPYTLLSKISPDHQWFIVVDLKDALFWACPRWRIGGISLPLNGRTLRQGENNNTDRQSFHKVSPTP